MKNLIIGGVRCGKSAYAESCLLEQGNVLQLNYIATSIAFGDETKSRIKLHQQRRGEQFATYELDYQQQNLAGLICSLNSEGQGVLLECMSTWVGWWLSHNTDLAVCLTLFQKQKESLLTELRGFKGDIYIITSEVGCGLIGESKLMRCFADEMGLLNQELAAISDSVTQLVAGLPQKLK